MRVRLDKTSGSAKRVLEPNVSTLMEATNMSMRSWISAIVAGLIVVLSGPAQAHHSVGSFYDTSKTISITGVLKAVKIINPHARIELEETKPNGQKVLWVTTTTSGTRLVLAGFTKDMLVVGSKVTLEGNPTRKEGVNSIVVNSATTADGKTINLRDAPSSQ